MRRVSLTFSGKIISLLDCVFFIVLEKFMFIGAFIVRGYFQIA
jgi:hypothetical protein